MFAPLLVLLLFICPYFQSEPLLSVKEEAIDKTFDEFNEMFLQKVKYSYFFIACYNEGVMASQDQEQYCLLLSGIFVFIYSKKITTL